MKFNRNQYIFFIQENVVESVVCKIASISFRPKWVKKWNRLNRQDFHLQHTRSVYRESANRMMLILWNVIFLYDIRSITGKAEDYINYIRQLMHTLHFCVFYRGSAQSNSIHIRLWLTGWHESIRIHYMMTSSNGNIFRVTGHLCGEFTGHRWIPPTKASDAELGCFLWFAPWINGWVNNREAGDFRRHRAHYDVIVMKNRNQNTGQNPWAYSIICAVFTVTS